MEDHSAPVRSGDLIAGKYEVEKVLGQGGMGVVVVAMHVELRQRVAIKFLLPGACHSGIAVERFLREARASVQLGGEHVVRVLDVGRLENGAPYMVMELLSGQDLDNAIETGGALPVERAVGFALQVCLGLAEAHRLGIVHRDLKPANLFLTQTNDGSTVIKVLDFGISKLVTGADSNASLTSTSHLVGSPAYMSPEQIRDAKRVDFRTDIWALGAILYEMLLAQKPFDADTLPGMLAAVIESPPTKPLSSRADLPPALVQAVERCLEKDPARRFQNVAELAQALAPLYGPQGFFMADRAARILGVSPTPAVAASLPGVPGVPTLGAVSAAPAVASGSGVVAMPVADPAVSSPTGGAWGKSADGTAAVPWHKQHPAIAISLVLVVLVALAGTSAGAWWMTRSREPTVSAAVSIDDAASLALPRSPPPEPAAAPTSRAPEVVPGAPTGSLETAASAPLPSSTPAASASPARPAEGRAAGRSHAAAAKRPDAAAAVPAAQAAPAPAAEPVRAATPNPTTTSRPTAAEQLGY